MGHSINILMSAPPRKCFREIKGTDLATPSEMTFEIPSLPLGFPCTSRRGRELQTLHGMAHFVLTEKPSMAATHNAWFNFTCYHPPRATPGTSPALRSRGMGNCLKPSCPGGRGWGKSKITSCCSCEVRHFSVDAGPRGEFLEVVADWLEKNNLSKLKSVFKGTFILNCWTDGVRHKQRNISSAYLCIY